MSNEQVRNRTVVPTGELREFGLLMAAAFGVLGLIRWWLKGVLPAWLFGIAAAFLVIGVTAPALLRPVHRGWTAFAEVLNWVMTRLLLGIAFYGLLTPARLLNQWFGSDPLKRRRDPAAPTYWEDPEDQPAERERYFQQF
jgi:hypothetical protein